MELSCQHDFHLSDSTFIPFIPYNICPYLVLFWGRVISINFKEFILGKFTESPLSARAKRFKPKPTLPWKPAALPSNFINYYKASGNLKEEGKVRFILSSPSHSSYGWQCLISKILSGLMGAFFCNISCHACNYLRKIRRWIYITCIKYNISLPGKKNNWWAVFSLLTWTFQTNSWDQQVLLFSRISFLNQSDQQKLLTDFTSLFGG